MLYRIMFNLVIIMSLILGLNFIFLLLIFLGIVFFRNFYEVFF